MLPACCIIVAASVSIVKRLGTVVTWLLVGLLELPSLGNLMQPQEASLQEMLRHGVQGSSACYQYHLSETQASC